MEGSLGRACVVLLGVAVGLVAVWVGRDYQDAGHAAVDLLTGWAVISCGLVGRAFQPSSRIGPLLVLTGFAWFAWNFSALPDPMGAAMAALVFVHRGLLVHAIVTFPRGRIGSRGVAAVVVAGYAAALATWIWTIPAAAAVLGFALALVAVVVSRRTPGLFRHAAAYAMWAGISLAGVIIVGAAVRAFSPTPGATSAASIVYAVGVVACALLLSLGLLQSRRRTHVADLVIEVGTSAGRGLQNALAWALGDSRLRLHLVDAAGRGGSEVTQLGAAPNRAVTVVYDADGSPLAAIDHVAGDLDEPGLAEAVTVAVRLDVRNARLRALVADQVAEVRESQRRLLRAADDEGKRLVSRLEDGAGSRLVRIGELLDEAGGVAATRATRTELAEARERLDETAADLDAIAHGLAPRSLARYGLVAAIALASARSRTPLTVDVDVPELPGDIETAAYFCVVEAITNIDKHAAAASGHVAVTTGDGQVLIEVRDDGVGGARVEPGSGLQGVADRITALGGTFDVTTGSGTRKGPVNPRDGAHGRGGTAVRATLPAPTPTRGSGR